MVKESFGKSAAAFETAKAFHRVVPLLHEFFQLLALVTEAGLVLTVAGRTDVYPVRRMKHLRLRTAHHLEIVQFEAAVKPAPGIQHQNAADGVVAVSVDGPVRDDDIRLLAVEQF